MAKKGNYTRKTPEEKQKEIEELTAQMTEKLDSYFESKENILEHLRFMSNFYNYSPRNMALIDNQFKGARAVGSFNFWKSKGVSINKGEKGIKILVPTPIEYFNYGHNQDGKPLWKQVKYANEKEKEKLEKGQYITKKVLFYKVGHVFEYTQTNAREKGLEVSEIFGRYHRTGTVENDKEFMKAFEKVAENVGVKIVDQPPIELGTAKGAFFPDLNIIALNPRNTMADNVPTMVHELAHAELHNRERERQREKPLTTNEEEFQAEMVAYVVSSRYGIDIEKFSLSYLANWTKEATIEDKEQLLNEVRQTASKFIKIIDEHLEKEKEKQLEFEKPIFLVNYGTLSHADITPVNTKDDLLEKIREEKAVKELEQITDLNEFVSTFNEQMADKYYLYEQTDDRPKILIQFSEHDQLEKNQLWNFGEANDFISHLDQKHLTEKQAILEQNNDSYPDDLSMMMYYKTRYHVIVPRENEVTLINPDRLDIADGYYNSPYQQLISEKSGMIENEKRSVGELNKEIHNKLLTDIAVHTHEKQYGDISIKEPAMILHGYTTEFKDFGKLNNIDYDKLNATQIKYTIAVPHDEKLHLYSNYYEKGEYVFPLDQIEKDEKFSKDIYNKLESSWNKELVKQDDLYINSWSNRVRQEVNKSEQVNESKFEMNR
jgi:hypothetical protein